MKHPQQISVGTAALIGRSDGFNQLAQVLTAGIPRLSRRLKAGEYLLGARGSVSELGPHQSQAASLDYVITCPVSHTVTSKN